MNNDNTVILIDNGLISSNIHHNFNYNNSLYKYAVKEHINFYIIGNTLFSECASNYMPVSPVFRYDNDKDFYPYTKNIKVLNLLLNSLRHNIEFYFDLKKALKNKLCTNTTVLMPAVITHKHLLAWSCWIKSLPLNSEITVVLMFMIKSPRPILIGKIFFKILELLSFRKKVRIVTDNKRLAIEYSVLTHLPVEVFPLPMTYNLLDSIKCNIQGQNKKLTFVALGGIRRNDEKGFNLLCKAIKRLGEQGYLENISFIIQAHKCHSDVDSESFIKELIYYPNVTIITQPLKIKDYYQLLNTADIILLPYKQQFYYARTSGILIEAFALGKPVIVTDNTWMSEQLENFGAGITFQDGNVEDLLQAILEAKKQYLELSNKAYNKRSICIDYYSPKTFFRTLLKIS